MVFVQKKPKELGEKGFEKANDIVVFGTDFDLWFDVTFLHESIAFRVWNGHSSDHGSSLLHRCILAHSSQYDFLCKAQRLALQKRRCAFYVPISNHTKAGFAICTY